ncbi:glycosyltransferase family 2 protein [Methylobacterium sp. P31]
MCLNEEKMIPYFLLHYINIVDKICIFDNGSTDKSLDLLKGDEKINVQEVKTEGESFCHFYRELMNTAWKNSRHDTDWILTAEMDEHLHHPDLRSYLDHCREVGTTILKATGFEMITDQFPTDSRPLWMHVTHGAREKLCDKPAIFDPKAINEINYDHGRHLAAPQGNVRFEEFPQVKLLHYKSLGLEYVCERNRILAGGSDRRTFPREPVVIIYDPMRGQPRICIISGRAHVACLDSPRDMTNL